MIVLVTGGRDYADEEHIRLTFIAFIAKHGAVTKLIVGDAKGADSLAKMVAWDLGIDVDVHYARWEEFGKRAGVLRNQEMVDRRPDFCLPFRGGNGTRDCVSRCNKAGIPFFFLRS